MINEFSFNVTIYYPTMYFVLCWVVAGMVLSPITMARMMQLNKGSLIGAHRRNNSIKIIIFSFLCPALSLMVLPQLIIQYKNVKDSGNTV